MSDERKPTLPPRLEAAAIIAPIVRSMKGRKRIHVTKGDTGEVVGVIDDQTLVVKMLERKGIMFGVDSIDAKKSRRESKGGAFESRGKFFMRVTTAPQTRTPKLLPWCTSLDDAKARANEVQTLVNRLRDGRHDELIEKLVEVSATANASGMAHLATTIESITSVSRTYHKKGRQRSSVYDFDEMREHVDGLRRSLSYFGMGSNDISMLIGKLVQARSGAGR